MSSLWDKYVILYIYILSWVWLFYDSINLGSLNMRPWPTIGPWAPSWTQGPWKRWIIHPICSIHGGWVIMQYDPDLITVCVTGKWMQPPTLRRPLDKPTLQQWCSGTGTSHHIQSCHLFNELLFILNSKWIGLNYWTQIKQCSVNIWISHFLLERLDPEVNRSTGQFIRSQ